MKIETEAQAFVFKRQQDFEEELNKNVKKLQQYIMANLYNSFEKDEAIKNLIEVQMWAERCSKMHGIKN